jgi:hypothetical protein
MPKKSVFMFLVSLNMGFSAKFNAHPFYLPDDFEMYLKFHSMHFSHGMNIVYITVKQKKTTRTPWL